jgi:hypothetical protein
MVNVLCIPSRNWNLSVNQVALPGLALECCSNEQPPPPFPQGQEAHLTEMTDLSEYLYQSAKFIRGTLLAIS